MDLSFFRRAERVFARRSAAPLDYRVLVATLEALQSASPAARGIRSAHERADLAPSHDPIAELLLGGPAWRDAVGAQGGCFNRGQVKLLGRRP
jgi:hypothetical protein